jgi:hypothetical protein
MGDLCISCASVGGSGKPSSVFVELTIPLEKLSSTILTMQRPVGDWKMLFLSVRNQPDITTDEANELAERSSKSSPRGFMTPRKAEKPRWVESLASAKEDVVTLFKPISLTDHTEGLVEVAEDLSAELEAGELRIPRLEDDVGMRQIRVLKACSNWRLRPKTGSTV